MRRPSWLAFGIMLHAGSAFASGADSAAARAHLQQGVTLKQQGKCEEALPYFVESIRMGRQPKALLNLADCEEKLRRLAAAQSHWVETRDVARELGLAYYEKSTVERLAALEKANPKLVVKIARDAPRDTVVTRDGVELSQVSLNTPLPIDTGKHSVVARTTTLERQYDVALVESETKELEVTPIGGTTKVAKSAPSSPLASSQPSSPSPAKSLDSRESTVGPSATAASGDVAESSGSNAQRTAGFVAAAVGVVGFAVGTISRSSSLPRTPMSTPLARRRTRARRATRGNRSTPVRSTTRRPRERRRSSGSPREELCSAPGCS